jgi:hypothetical protein
MQNEDLLTNNKPADGPVSERFVLSGLWASTIFCYIYADFFGLFRKGRMASMNEGMILPLGEATPMVLLAVSVMMAIPSLMVVLSLILPARFARWSNIVFGLAFTFIQGATMIGGAPPFYLFFGTIEMLMTLSIVWTAWRWSRTKRTGK